MLLFWYQQTKKRERTRNFIFKGLYHEIEFNLTVIEKWLKEIEVRKRWLSRSRDETYFPLRCYSDTLQTHFLRKSIEGGSLYNQIDKKDFSIIVDFLLIKDSHREDKINHMMNEIFQYRQSGLLESYPNKISNLELELELEDTMLKTIRDVLISVDMKRSLEQNNMKNDLKTLLHDTRNLLISLLSKRFH